MRQAIRLAVDVPAIIEAAFEGKWERATAIIPEGMGLGYWADAPVYDRDVDGAKLLSRTPACPGLELSFMFTDQTGSQASPRSCSRTSPTSASSSRCTRSTSATFYALGKNCASRELIFIGFSANPAPPGRQCGSRATSWTSGTGCTGATRSTTACTSPRSRRRTTDKRNEMYIEMQRLWDEAAHTIWLVWPTATTSARQGIEPAITPDARVLSTASRAV